MSNVLVLRTSVNGDKSFSNQLIDNLLPKPEQNGRKSILSNVI